MVQTTPSICILKYCLLFTEYTHTNNMTKKKSSTELPADTMDDSSGLNMKSRSKKRKFEEKSETPTEHHRQKKPRRNKLEQCSETTDDCTVHDVKHKKEKSVEPIQPNCNSDNGVTKLKHHKSKKNKLPLDSSGPPVNSEITLPNSDDVKPVLTPEQKMAKERNVRRCTTRKRRRNRRLQLTQKNRRMIKTV